MVDELGLHGYHLLGHSMGGSVVMRYALAAQDTGRGPASLVLMDTSATPMTALRTVFGPAFEIARTEGMNGVMSMIEPFPPPGPALDRMRVECSQMDPVAFTEHSPQEERPAEWLAARRTHLAGSRLG